MRALLQVHLVKPQETLMWEAFAQAARDQQGAFWVNLARLTQQVVLAVDASARLGKAIRVEDLSPMTP